MKKIITPLIFCAITAMPSLAAAQSKDLEVAVRTFKFIDGTPSDVATLGIVYDPANEASQKQANALAAALGESDAVAGVTLTPKLLSPTDVSGADILFVTDGLEGSHEAIAAAAKGAKVITISTDMACVESQHCVMGVRSEPQVELVLSRGATEETGLTINQALKMMVQELD